MHSVQNDSQICTIAAVEVWASARYAMHETWTKATGVKMSHALGLLAITDYTAYDGRARFART